MLKTLNISVHVWENRLSFLYNMYCLHALSKKWSVLWWHYYYHLLSWILVRKRCDILLCLFFKFILTIGEKRQNETHLAWCCQGNQFLSLQGEVWLKCIWCHCIKICSLLHLELKSALWNKQTTKTQHNNEQNKTNPTIFNTCDY